MDAITESLLGYIGPQFVTPLCDGWQRHLVSVSGNPLTTVCWLPPQDLTHQMGAAMAALQASKNTWFHKTLSSIKEAAKKESG